MQSKIFKINYLGNEFEISTLYRDSGNELIFFIHGLGCAKESFENAWQFSELNDFSLLSLDLVGFGDSSRIRDFSYTMEAQAEICNLLIDEIKPEKIHIVAHSMGGAVGLFMAEKISDKLVSFMNVEGNLIDEDCGLLSRKTINVSYEKFRDKLFPQIKFFAKKANDVGSQLWYEWSEKADELGFYKSSVSLVEWTDSGELLNKFNELNCKKVYFHGEKSAVKKLLLKLQSFEDLKIIPISNSGHFVMNDNSGEFYWNLAKEIKA